MQSKPTSDSIYGGNLTLHRSGDLPVRPIAARFSRMLYALCVDMCIVHQSAISLNHICRERPRPDLALAAKAAT